jgi:hypothetical protein
MRRVHRLLGVWARRPARPRPLRAILWSPWFWTALFVVWLVGSDTPASAGMIDWIPGASETVDAIRAGVAAAFDAAWAAMMTVASAAVQATIDGIDLTFGGLSPTVAGTIGMLFAAASYWFPMLEILTMVGLYWSAVASLAFLKWLLKAAPFVG